MATQLPAVVTIQDLPAGSTPTGTELVEAVQTSAGVANSVQLSLTQIVNGAAFSSPVSVANGGTNTSTLTANGIVYGNAGATVGITAAGGTSIPLLGQGAGNAPVFGVLPVIGGGTNTTILTQNGLVYGNGTNTIGITAAGATSVPFLGQGVGNAPAFGTVSQMIDTVNTSQGSVLYRSSTSWVALGTGTLGYLLQTQGAAANPQWVGGMSLLNTLSPNAVASSTDTTSLTGNYRSYLVTFENITPATNSTFLEMQIATNGANWVTGSYVSQVQQFIGGNAVSDTSTTVLLLSGTRATTSVGNSTTYGVNGFIRIMNPAATTFRKHIVGELTYLSGSTSGTSAISLVTPSGYFDGNNNAVTGMAFLFNSGNITTGTIKIYGLSG
jgi:hypothetical protein